jgi:hypothetical protein
LDVAFDFFFGLPPCPSEQPARERGVAFWGGEDGLALILESDEHGIALFELEGFSNLFGQDHLAFSAESDYLG